MYALGGSLGLILDVMLPQMSGTEALRILRQQEATAAIPVLMLTAKAEPADRIAGLPKIPEHFLRL